MWRILLLLLFARESIGCECPGISIDGTDQSYCWQIVDRNASTWTSADDACSAVGGRMGQPEDIETLDLLATYLRPIYSLPVLTGYVVGNAQTGDIAMVCPANEFLAVANDTLGLILGTPSDTEQCVFITNNDFMMHFGPCTTAAVVLCSQPENSTDYCSVAPTCRSSTALDYNATTSFRTTNTIDVDNSTKSSTAFSPLTGTFSTGSKQSTTTGNDSLPDPSKTTLLPSASTTTSSGGGPDGSTTAASCNTTCRKGGVWLFGWCVPLWLLIPACILAVLSAILLAWCFGHYCCNCCWCHGKKPDKVKDVERGPHSQAIITHEKAVQCDPPVEPEITLPPPVMQPAAIIPAPIPIDYTSVVDKPETEDKAMMTDPWELPEPVIIYRERAPEPKVEYEREERMILPPPPITARSEAPQFMDSEDDEPSRHRIVAAPIAVIVRPHRRSSPPLPSPREPFPALPRRALTDEDLPLAPRQPAEKKKKRERPQLEPVVFLHNAPPEERPYMDEPEFIPTPSRGPRAFPPPPPVSRSSPIQDRPFPEQFKSSAPADYPERGPKQSRLLPPSPPADPPRRERSPEPPAPITSSQKRPLTRAPASRPVINQEPEPPRNERRSAQPPSPASEPIRQPSAAPAPSAKPAPPVRPSSGGGRPAAAAPVRTLSSSPPRRAAPPPRATSPFAPKQNSVAPALQGSLFKAAPPSNASSNLRAANGKLGGVAGGHGEVPRGWKAWSPNARTFSATPGSDI